MTSCPTAHYPYSFNKLLREPAAQVCSGSPVKKIISSPIGDDQKARNLPRDIL